MDRKTKRGQGSVTSAGQGRERGRKTLVKRGISELRISKEVRPDVEGSSMRTRHTSERWQRGESARKDPPGPALPGVGNSPESQKSGE